MRPPNTHVAGGTAFKRFRFNQCGGMIILETALCLILFVTILLATISLFVFLLNRQTIEHAIYSNAAKVGTVPYRITTKNGTVGYELSELPLQREIDNAADSLNQLLSSELMAIGPNDLTIQVGYIQVAGTANELSVGRWHQRLVGDPIGATTFPSLSAPRLHQVLAGITLGDNSAPPPIVLRIRVNLKTDSFTKFDILRVAPRSIIYDVIIPLRQQAGILTMSYSTHFFGFSQGSFQW